METLKQTHYLLVCYVPESHLESLKSALFQAGAGDFGNYDMACWQSKGMGQYRPIKDANPHLGVLNKLEQLEEYKIEIIVANDKLFHVLNALKKAHPYEVPAYQLTPFFV
jgi:hypothetical protein